MKYISYSEGMYSSFNAYTALEHISSNQSGTFIVDDNDYTIYSHTYSAIDDAWEHRFLSYNESGRLERIHIFQRRGNERFDYLIQFDHHSETQVLYKKVLVESNLVYHDQLLEDSNDLDDLNYYQSLLPTKHNKIVETKVIDNISELITIPKPKFIDTENQVWNYEGQDSNEKLLEEDEKCLITAEDLSEDNLSLIKLRKYEYDCTLQTKVLSVLKILGNSRGKYEVNPSTLDKQAINWTPCPLMDKYFSELELIVTEVYFYNSRGLSFIENDEQQLVITNFENDDEKTEIGTVVSKESYKSDPYVEKVQISYSIEERKGLSAEAIYTNLKSRYF